MTVTTIGDLDAVMARQKAMWMAGDFGQIAKFTQTNAEEFVKRCAVKAGLRVLDLACGTGNTAIPAARAGARVTGLDIAPNLLDQARARAEREGLMIRFDEGDVEELPYAAASFDLVISMFGAMFGPRPNRVVGELVRVCRPGGRIAMASWTPRGFIGQIHQIMAKYAPVLPDLPSPLLWGDEATVRERLRVLRRGNGGLSPHLSGTGAHDLRGHAGRSTRGGGTRDGKSLREIQSGARRHGLGRG